MNRDGPDQTKETCRSTQGTEFLALLTVAHRVPGSNLTEDEIHFMSVQCFIAQSFLYHLSTLSI